MKILSSNSVLNSAINEVEEILNPKIFINKPQKIVFDFGTHLDGAPHLGTYAVLTLAFLLAERVQNDSKIETEVLLTGLDNGPIETLTFENHEYYKNLGYALKVEEIRHLIDQYYGVYLNFLATKTNITYKINTYREQQLDINYRKAFFATIKHSEKINFILSPKDKKLRIRTECPICGLVEKEATANQYEMTSDESILIHSFCPIHKSYTLTIDLLGTQYLDLNSLYRNLVKETSYTFKPNLLGVMIKGEDWFHGSQLVDLAHSILGKTLTELPTRVFTPKITFLDGDKISKTTLKKSPDKKDEIHKDLSDILNNINNDPRTRENLFNLGMEIIKKPNNFYRSYSHKEIERIIATLS